ncbi:MAG TPA: HAD family phosphatase [Rhizomicrobium sp.]|nr:HAD family phosphatase [Rhizomicrobium sp.]
MAQSRGAAVSGPAVNSLAGISHFLFDLDGTLVDSSPLHEEAFRAVLAQDHAGLLTDFDYAAIAGLSTAAALAELGVAQADIPRLAGAKQAHYRAALGRLGPQPGAAGVLERLQKRGGTIAVVTSASRASATAALAATGLSVFVSLLVAAEEAARAKPAPDLFLAALHGLNTQPSHSIAIEDAVSGVQSARAAGLKVIGMHQEAVRGLSDFYFPGFADFAKFLA